MEFLVGLFLLSVAGLLATDCRRREIGKPLDHQDMVMSREQQSQHALYYTMRTLEISCALLFLCSCATLIVFLMLT